MNQQEAQAIKAIYFDKWPEIDAEVDMTPGKKPRIYVTFPELIREKREFRFDGKVKKGEFSPEWEKYFHAGDLILLRRSLRVGWPGFVIGSKAVPRQKKFLRDGKRPTMTREERDLLTRMMRKQ